MSIVHQDGQIYHPFHLWEDCKAGFYATVNRDSHVMQSAQVLSSELACREAMRAVLAEWPVSCEVNLTNVASNRRAWLGQAACCLKCGSSSIETCRAWATLEDAQQREANRIADEVIAEWELSYAKTGAWYRRSSRSSRANRMDLRPVQENLRQLQWW